MESANFGSYTFLGSINYENPKLDLLFGSYTFLGSINYENPKLDLLFGSYTFLGSINYENPKLDLLFGDLPRCLESRPSPSPPINTKPEYSHE